MIKKRISLMISAFMLSMAVFTGCGSDGSSSVSVSSDAAAEKAQQSSEPLNIVCTIYPEYDWVNEIIGDKAKEANITYLLDNGVDLHSFQPTVDDIMKISEADLFVYVGGESDEWVDDTLKQADNDDLKTVNLMEVLGDSAKVEELKEGMQESEHEHSHEKKEVSEDRTLSDYVGEWQSVYPFMDDEFKKSTASYMAEAEGFDSDDEAWDFFYKGNETDVRYVNIKDDSIEFIKEDGTKTSGTYAYDGFYSDCWGETSIRYQFKNIDSSSDAPAYVQFDDHLNYPTKAEHFHVYCGEDPKAMLDIKYNWPTYYPKSIETKEDMIHEFLKHYISDEDDEHEEEVEYDEHVWLSLKNAKVLCTEIEKNIEAIDPANAEAYKSNLDSYVSKLDELDGKFTDLTSKASNKTLIFGDRFPFRYFVDDYGLDYYAAFIGCSAESEASFETVTFLANKADELNCNTIFTIENSDRSIANTIIETSQKGGQNISELNSLQSVSADDIKNGTSYLSIMEENYNVLSEYLKG